MIFFIRITFIVSILFLLVGLKGEPRPKDTPQTDDPNTNRFVEKQVKQMMRQHHLPGFAISIVVDHEVIFQEAYGLADIEKNINATTETIFKLWSVAKPFTAMEIFREVEAGLIDLDTPIEDILPNFSIHKNFDDNRPITIQSILAHRAGLPRNSCTSVFDPSSRTGALAKFEMESADCYMAFPVGFRYKYSNLGYCLLGRIIEQNRGENYTSYMKKNLLDDLEMHNSTFTSKDIKNPNKIAQGYEFYKGQYYPMDQLDVKNVPSGNLYSTIEDLSVFLKSILINEGIFQNEETLPSMFSDKYSRTSDPETMGLGWKTCEILGSKQLIWHDGGPSDGIGTMVAFMPNEKLGIALISNGTSFGGNVSVPMAVEIFQYLLKQRSGFVKIPYSVPKRVALRKAKLDSYTGKYVAFGTIMNVELKKKKLKGKITGFGLDLIPVSETGFRVTHWAEKIGLTKIIKPPIDFKRIRIDFPGIHQADSIVMIINIDDISNEICPIYPEYDEYWSGLVGEYIGAERLPNNKTGKSKERRFSISLQDSVLVMSGQIGPIAPINENFIRIESGSFAGELMEYNRKSGNIIHQNVIYIPVKSELI